ncbi:hypothetical protein KUCAC02_033717, partial [Chaenocephalus aceratus]
EELSTKERTIKQRGGGLPWVRTERKRKRKRSRCLRVPAGAPRSNDYKNEPLTENCHQTRAGEKTRCTRRQLKRLKERSDVGSGREDISGVKRDGAQRQGEDITPNQGYNDMHIE